MCNGQNGLYFQHAQVKVVKEKQALASQLAKTLTTTPFGEDTSENNERERFSVTQGLKVGRADSGHGLCLLPSPGTGLEYGSQSALPGRLQ